MFTHTIYFTTAKPVSNFLYYYFLINQRIVKEQNYQIDNLV